MDQHAIIADMDRPLVAASDFIAASRASSKCKSLLITLNLVGMLCFNEPIAPNLPPLLPLHPLPLAVLYRPQKQPTPAVASAAAARAAKVAAAACHYYGPGVVTAAGPGVVTLRRLAPTCPAAEPLPALLPGHSDQAPSCMLARRHRAPTGPAAGSPGLDKPAPQAGVADIKHRSLR